MGEEFKFPPLNSTIYDEVCEKLINLSSSSRNYAYCFVINGWKNCTWCLMSSKKKKNGKCKMRKKTKKKRNWSIRSIVCDTNKFTWSEMFKKKK